MTDALVSGLLAGYGVAIPVGAIGVFIVSLAARTSLRIGAGAALGVAAADTMYAIVASLGGAAIASLVAPVAAPLRIVAASVLFGMASRIAWTAWRHRHDPTRTVRTTAFATAPRAFGALVGLTVLNPATVIYFAALVLGQKGSGVTAGPARATVWVLAVAVASASWQLLLAVGGSALGRRLSSDRGRLATAVVSSVLIVYLATATLLG